MYLFQRIEEIMMEYQDARKVIAEFLLNEKSHLYQYTMDDIANLTFTSKSTLVRFAKMLGFNGWKDFMRAIMEEVKYEESHDKTIDVNFPFNEKDSYHEIIEQMSRLQIESIRDTSHFIQEKTLEQAIIRLDKANHIVLFGIKPNSYYAESLRWKFLSIGIHIHIGQAGELGMLSRMLTKNDCAIIISYSGNNIKNEPMRYIETFKQNNVPMIGITSGGKNYISENVDCVFSISSSERLYSKISAFATEQSILYIFNVIYACFFKKNYHENLVYKISNSKILEEQRIASINALKEK